MGPTPNQACEAVLIRRSLRPCPQPTDSTPSDRKRYGYPGVSAGLVFDGAEFGSDMDWTARCRMDIGPAEGASHCEWIGVNVRQDPFRKGSGCGWETAAEGEETAESCKICFMCVLSEHWVGVRVDALRTVAIWACPWSWKREIGAFASGNGL